MALTAINGPATATATATRTSKPSTSTPKGATPPNPLTSLLSRFGVDYQNAPQPTPALLAFMRGVGMSMDTAEDAARVNEMRMKERASQSQEEVTRQNDRTLARMAGDLQMRGVLSSGETNTRVGRQAEDVAYSRGQIEQTLAEGIDRSQQGLAQTRDTFRQQALERVLQVEEANATREATAKATELQWQRQQEAADLAYKRSKEAQDEAYRRQEELYKKYSGVVK